MPDPKWGAEEAEEVLEAMPVPSSCSCEGCQAACANPCWPTPSEARAIIDAGFGDRLMRDWWARMGPNLHLLAPAVKGREGCFAPSQPLFGWSGPATACTFQTPEGLCELHDLGLKPREAKIAHCEGFPEHVHELTASTWVGAEDLVDEWERRFLK